LRTAQFEWFLKAANYRGGASFEKFLEFIRHDAEASLGADERTALAEVLARKPEKKSPLQQAAAALAGRTTVTEWQLDTLAPQVEARLRKRSFDNGRKMFGAAGCFACHRFENEGGMTGPDLTGAGGRYSARDLLDQILHPSKEINEQFVPMVITKQDGETVTGVIVNLNGDNVMVNTDPANPFQQETIDRKKVASIEPSKTSPMPEGLLGLLTADEIADLTAYVLSGGDRKHAMFR
jgi:putative heme-binding domain-containing protein